MYSIVVAMPCEVHSTTRADDTPQTGSQGHKRITLADDRRAILDGPRGGCGGLRSRSISRTSGSVSPATATLVVRGPNSSPSC